MRSQSLSSLSATKLLGDVSVRASPRRSSRPHLRLHREANSYTRCTHTSPALPEQGSLCYTRQPYRALISRTQRLAASSRHFSHTPRALSTTTTTTATTPPVPPSSSTSSDGPSPQPTARSRKPVFIHFALISSVLAGALYYTNEKRKSRFLLNDQRFMPCPVISNEPISPDAFILTIQTPLTALVQTRDTTTNHDVLERAWAHGLWSVEVKQPQLQIARSYTPLPPAPGGEDAMTDQERQRLRAGLVPLRLYVRRYDGGEVSTYLSRLQKGDLVEIRGPHLGFDVGARLGDAGDKVVFLAGGTGIAPAVQAAAVLLRRPGDVDVEILWANRSGADCAGCPRLTGRAKGGLFSWGKQAVGGAHLEESPSAIMRQLQALQAAYAQKGRTLEVRCVVDDEGNKFRPRDITQAISVGKQGAAAAAVTSSTCYLHSQQRLEHSTEADDTTSIADTTRQAGEEKISCGLERRRCNCPSQGGGGAGKDLFMISGPDGFVGAYVGPKVWADGAERQGRVGGVVAELMRRDPMTWDKWLVLKQ